MVSGSFLLATVVAGASGMMWLRSSLPARINHVSATGLTAPVEVLRDAHGVPHIFAAADEDAAFALGFVHAQDRLWQMESTRRLGAGRLAEILGPSALRSDRFIRTLGLYRLAEQQYAQLSEEVRQAFDAYAAGVNAWLASRKGALPPEFLALGYEPERWRSADSLASIKTMAVRLASNRHVELLRARLAQRLTPGQIAELWPPDPSDGPITIAGLTEDLGGLPLGLLAAADPPASRASGGASNVWVVSGRNAVTEKPLLANDPHLWFSAPILWYLARIETPELTLAGATIPGIPFLILGHNDRIAWGMTMTESDVEDLFVEQQDPLDPRRYVRLGGSESFQMREEVIKVKGEEDVPVSVRSTRHGPVILEAAPGDNKGNGTSFSSRPQKALALAATYLHEGDRTPEAGFRLNRARNWNDLVTALHDLHSPPYNLAYADVEGNIGFIVAGRVPIRRSGRGLAPSPGWTGEADWIGFVPFEALPKVSNPASGRLVNANNRVVGDDYPWHLGDGWDEGFRAQRILDLLDAEPRRHSLKSFAAMQMDAVSLMARRLLSIMLPMMPERERYADPMRMLRVWSGDMARDRAEPLLFAVWLRELNRAIYADELGPLFADYWGYRPRVVESILTRNQGWCDDITTAAREDCSSRLEVALDAALTFLADRLGRDPRLWRWGEVHKARFEHTVLGHIPLIGRFANLATATDGGEDTLQRGASRISDTYESFANVHGAGFRAIYDLADLKRSRFVIATGQSGNPLSPHYRDQFALWREGGSIELGQTREDLEREESKRLTLMP